MRRQEKSADEIDGQTVDLGSEEVLSEEECQKVMRVKKIDALIQETYRQLVLLADSLGLALDSALVLASRGENPEPQSKPPEELQETSALWTTRKD